VRKYLFDAIVTGSKYIKMLEESVVPNFDQLFEDEDI
jgi:hypothetical protein